MFGLGKLFNGKEYEIQDSWDMCYIGNEKNNLMRINSTLKEFADKVDFPISTIFAVPLDNFDAESSIPFDFEDMLFEQIQGKRLGVIIAVVTNSETRDFLTYTKNEKTGNRIKKIMKGKFPTIECDVSDRNDEKWEIFSNLLPRS